MDDILPNVDYLIARYYGRLAVGPARLDGPVLAPEDGGTPLEHKWRFTKTRDGSFYIHTASKPVLYVAIDGEPEEYSPLFARDLPFKWRLQPIAAPNEYLIVPAGLNINLVLSDLPWDKPRTALVAKKSSTEDVKDQAWVIQKLSPPSHDEAPQSIMYSPYSRFSCCRTAFLSRIL